MLGRIYGAIPAAIARDLTHVVSEKRSLLWFALQHALSRRSSTSTKLVRRVAMSSVRGQLMEDRCSGYASMRRLGLGAPRFADFFPDFFHVPNVEQLLQESPFEANATMTKISPDILSLISAPPGVPENCAQARSRPHPPSLPKACTTSACSQNLFGHSTVSFAAFCKICAYEATAQHHCPTAQLLDDLQHPNCLADNVELLSTFGQQTYCSKDSRGI